MKIRQVAQRLLRKEGISTGIPSFDQALKYSINGKQEFGFPRGSLTLLVGNDAYVIGSCFNLRLRLCKNFQFLAPVPYIDWDYFQSKKYYAKIFNRAVLAAIPNPPSEALKIANVIIESSRLGERQYKLAMVKNYLSLGNPSVRVELSNKQIVEICGTE